MTLEEQTKRYGAKLLFTDEFKGILSHEVKNMPNIRCVDYIQNQVDKKYQFYTFDLIQEHLESLPETDEIGNVENQEYYNKQMNIRFSKMRQMSNMDEMLSNPFFLIFESDYELSIVVNDAEDSNDCCCLLEKLNKMFKEAIMNYRFGEWSEALNQCNAIL